MIFFLFLADSGATLIYLSFLLDVTFAHLSGESLFGTLHFCIGKGEMDRRILDMDELLSGFMCVLM